VKTEEKRVITPLKDLPNCCYGLPEHFANSTGCQACLKCGHAEEFVERISDNNEKIITTIKIGCKNLVKKRLITSNKLKEWQRKEKYYEENKKSFI